MKRIGTFALIGISALALAGGITRAATPVDIRGAQLARESEPGDDHGGRGRGKDDLVLTARESEPGDDRGGRGRGKDDLVAMRSTTVADDKGGHGEPQPGDDKGGHHGGHGSDD